MPTEQLHAISAANIHERTSDMWYFAWLLGLPLAALFAVMNAMWFEMMEDDMRQKKEQQR